jgi:hypothetical protein
VQYIQWRTAVIGVNLRRIGRLKPQLDKQNLPPQVVKALVKDLASFFGKELVLKQFV